jgi:exopolysaccharide biosynthesis protein
MIMNDLIFGKSGYRFDMYFYVKLKINREISFVCSIIKLSLALLVFGVSLVQASVIISHPYQGITYISRTEITPRAVNMHIVLVELTKPGISFKITQPGGSRDTIRQTTLDFLNQEHAQVAINCHFFLPFPSTDSNSDVIGLAASQGNIYSPFEPQPVTNDSTDQSYAIIPYSPAVNIDPNNKVCIVHHDPTYSDNKHILEKIILWNAVSGSAQIITDGSKSIPTYSGQRPSLKAINGYSDDNSWYSIPKPRTVIGLTKDNKIMVLFTVDGTDGSMGMTCREVADVLVADYEVYNALNMDGGGSTTLSMENPATHTGQIMNKPSDILAGRAVGSNLAVFASDWFATDINIDSNAVDNSLDPKN